MFNKLQISMIFYEILLSFVLRFAEDKFWLFDDFFPSKVNVFALGESGADCKPGRNKFGKNLSKCLQQFANLLHWRV